MEIPVAGPGAWCTFAGRMEELLRYFPSLTEEQKDRFRRLEPLYQEWNAKINVISRKDMEHLYVRHVLHSLAIAKFITFQPETRVLDLGTGGGFPGIPLAILFPAVSFTLIDGTQKKIRVVGEVAEALALSNVRALAVRAEEHREKYEFVVSRAVAPLAELCVWSRHLLAARPQRHALPNGLIALKGGDLREEIRALPRKTATETAAISDWFADPWFESKQLVWVDVP